jgi:uncharacterized protein involved in outer membrane biogenesis
MKKIVKIILKIFVGLIAFLLLAIIAVPVLFKEQIKVKVEQVINETVNANVRFEDYSLSFLHNFPNLAFSLQEVSVVGLDKFAGDTLAGFRSFDLVFNLRSLFGDSGYKVKSIIVDRLVANAIVLKDGSANWDIMKDTGAEPAVDTTSSAPGAIKILLKKVQIKDGAISYNDLSSAMKASLNGIDFTLSGDMTASTTDLLMIIKIKDITFVMDGLKYLSRATFDSRIDILADLDNMKFTLRDNYLSINDIALNFSGVVDMPGDDITTDLTFKTGKTSFKSLLSMVPSVYMKDYQDLIATGDFSIEGYAKGIYSDADSTLPDIALALNVNNGLISYPDLPEKIQNISIVTNVLVDGKDLDKTLVDVSKFHFELAGSPFDMTLNLKTPMSDPDFSGSMKGKIDLEALTKAVPVDSMTLSGIIDMSVVMAGRMSIIEKEQYADFKAEGTMGIKNMSVAMIGYPAVKINSAGFTFTPSWTEMSGLDMNVGGKSDFILSGRLENYIPFMFSDGTIKGNLSMKSKFIDVTELMSSMSTDTTAVSDTTAMSLITIPSNIDFDFTAMIDKLSYDSINAENVKGHLILRDGVLSIRDAGMNILRGTINMNADYDTRDSLKPTMKADFKMNDIGVKDAFNTFVTVQKLAPAAKGIDGKVSFQLTFNSLIGNDMMPVTETINGYGKIQSDQLQLVDSPTFTKFTEALKLGDKYSNTFKDINISFNIKDGRVYVAPFDIKMANIKMNIAGDQGLDQTINYLVKTEVPRADLGSGVNSLIDNLSAQALKLGVSYKPADILKFNVKVSGTFTKPVVTPVLSGTGSSASSTIVESAKEAVKQVIDEKVEDVKAKVSAEAEAQAAKIMQEAEVKAQQIRDEAAKAAESLRGEANLQSQNLIKAAESKGPLAKIAAQKSADNIKKEADKKAEQLVKEADTQATNVINEATARKDAILKQI